MPACDMVARDTKADAFAATKAGELATFVQADHPRSERTGSRRGTHPSVGTAGAGMPLGG